MLEALADFDDDLLEKLLEDVTPAPDEIYQSLTRDLQQDQIVPVFFGSGEAMHGITRLLKALRHEAPEPAVSARRLGIGAEGRALRPGLQDASCGAYRKAVPGSRLARRTDRRHDA
jgi:elongation factor G